MGSRPSAKRAAWNAAVTVKNVLVHASVSDLHKTIGNLRWLPVRAVRMVAEMACHSANIWLWTRYISQDANRMVVGMVLSVSTNHRPVILACGREQWPAQFQNEILPRFAGARWRYLDRDVNFDHLQPPELYGPMSKPLFWDNPLCSLDTMYGWMQGYQNPYEQPDNKPLSNDFPQMRGYQHPYERPDDQHLPDDFLQMLRDALARLNSAYVPARHTPIGI